MKARSLNTLLLSGLGFMVLILLFMHQTPPVYVAIEGSKQILEPPTRTSWPATEFSQLGFLTPDAGENKILPLFGRRVRGDRWQYYTISNQHNDIKLPIKVGKRSALDSTGVNEVGSGDRILVHGYNEMFTVTLYDVDVRHVF